MKKMLAFFVLCVGLTLSIQAAGLPASLKAEPQQRDAASYSWNDRHEAILLRNKIVNPEYVIFGDSITHKWGGVPADNVSGVASDSWDALFGRYVSTNMGFGFDYIDNAYYRIKQGELDGISPRVITLLLGTNNIGHRKDSAQMCADNMKALLTLIRQKCPRSKILLLGVLPRQDFDFALPVIEETNKLYEKLANNKTIFFANPGMVLRKSGSEKPKKEYMADGVHLSSAGYKVLGEELQKNLASLDSQYTPEGRVDMVYIGDSITDNYRKAQAPLEDFAPIWKEFYSRYNTKNCGVSGNLTHDVLARIDKGMLDGISPKVAVIMIGTNDTGQQKTEQETLSGITKVVDAVKAKLPQAKILLLSILPSNIAHWHVPGARDPEGKFQADMNINKALMSQYKGNKTVTFLNISQVFLKSDGKVNEDLFYDPKIVVINGKKAGPLHPNTQGQRLMAQSIKPTLDKMMNKAIKNEEYQGRRKL